MNLVGMMSEIMKARQYDCELRYAFSKANPNSILLGFISGSMCTHNAICVDFRSLWRMTFHLLRLGSH